MEIDLNGRARMKASALLLILNICGHLNLVEGVCTTADVTPKALAASLTTMNIPYRYWDTTTSTRRYYLNPGGDYLDWYDNANTGQCVWSNCYYRFRNQAASNSWHSGTSIG